MVSLFRSCFVLVRIRWVDVRRKSIALGRFGLCLCVRHGFNRICRLSGLVGLTLTVTIHEVIESLILADLLVILSRTCPAHRRELRIR